MRASAGWPGAADVSSHSFSMREVMKLKISVSGAGAPVHEDVHEQPLLQHV